MRKTTFSFLVFLFAFVPLIMSAQNWSAEEKAVIDALNEEGAAFVDMDMDRLAAVHIQDGSAVRYSLSDDKALSGWDEIKANFETMFEWRKNNSDNFGNAKNTKENVIIRATGKTAWVLCDNVWNWEEGGDQKEMINKEIAFLEKEKGKWKFIPEMQTKACP
jgi:hypothetical protein